MHYKYLHYHIKIHQIIFLNILKEHLTQNINHFRLKVYSILRKRV